MSNARNPRAKQLDSRATPAIGETATDNQISSSDAEGWARKATPFVHNLLILPLAKTAPSLVETVRHSQVADGPFGGWMLTWPEAAPGRQLINHLPDGALFLSLLGRVYAPILGKRPWLEPILTDRSRLEMAVTNDVLQVQLLPCESHYSMIRHHALMLFEATLWLDNVSQLGWMELYGAAAGLAMEGRRSVPSRNELVDIEAAGFDAMSETAGLTTEISLTDDLLASPRLSSLVTYQLWATAALGALCRDYVAQYSGAGLAWHGKQLGSYQDEDYLMGTLRRWL